jgi:pantoate--beta-alanine ligase
MREVVRQARGRGLRVGYVPTMGYLHEGHISLIRLAKEMSDLVVVSIFVNPTQFGPAEDFDLYPRDLTRDADLCIAEGVDYLFTPEESEIYPQGSRTMVDPGDLGTRLEGAARPGHFRGVATVVVKLLNIVQPTHAVFGEKDVQQAAIIRNIAQDLMLDVEIIAGPAVRDSDGVALSSRNSRLNREQRTAAQAIPRAIEAARQRVSDGEPNVDDIIAVAREAIQNEPGLDLDYVELVDPETFEIMEQFDGSGLLLLAAYAGDVRLIDNATLQATKEE